MRRIIGNVLQYFLSAADGERINVVLSKEIQNGSLDKAMQERYNLRSGKGTR